MHKIIAPLAGVAVLSFGAGTAWAASPVYCALYAKEFVKHAVVDSQGSIPPSRIHDHAYYKCLNMDDEPVLPTAYTDPKYDGSNEPAGVVKGANDPSSEKPADGTSIGDTASSEPEPSSNDTKTPAGKRGGSGYAMWSREWSAWCAEHFPNSFDPKTGTVVPYKTGVKTICR